MLSTITIGDLIWFHRQDNLFLVVCQLKLKNHYLLFSFLDSRIYSFEEHYIKEYAKNLSSI